MPNQNTETTSQLLEQIKQLQKIKEAEELEVTAIKANPHETLIYIRLLEEEIKNLRSTQERYKIDINCINWVLGNTYSPQEKIEYLKVAFK